MTWDIFEADASFDRADYNVTGFETQQEASGFYDSLVDHFGEEIKDSASLGTHDNDKEFMISVIPATFSKKIDPNEVQAYIRKAGFEIDNAPQKK